MWSYAKQVGVLTSWHLSGSVKVNRFSSLMMDCVSPYCCLLFRVPALWTSCTDVRIHFLVGFLHSPTLELALNVLASVGKPLTWESTRKIKLIIAGIIASSSASTPALIFILMGWIAPLWCAILVHQIPWVLTCPNLLPSCPCTSVTLRLAISSRLCFLCLQGVYKTPFWNLKKTRPSGKVFICGGCFCYCFLNPKTWATFSSSKLFFSWSFLEV